MKQAYSKAGQKERRLYDGSRWRNARKYFLNSHALCVICEQQGRTSAASVVDHIRPHKGNVELFWDVKNWQSLCKSCHDSAKKIKENTGLYPGCDINGMPLDDNHWWGKK